MMKKTLLVPTQTIGNFELWTIFSKVKKETFIQDEEGLRVTVGYKIKQDENYSHKIMATLHLQHDGSPYTIEDSEAMNYLQMKNQQHLAINLYAEAYDSLDRYIGGTKQKEQPSDWSELLDFEVCEESEETEETEETKAHNLLAAIRAALR